MTERWHKRDQVEPEHRPKRWEFGWRSTLTPALSLEVSRPETW